MTVIQLETLAADLGMPGTRPVDATIQCTPWAGFRPAHRVDGAELVVPDHVQVTVEDGAVVGSLDLLPTGATFCWRIVVSTHSPKFMLERFVAVPETGPVDFGALVDVDPATFIPTPNVVAGWDAAWAASFASGEVDEDGHLILTTRDGSTEDVGNVTGTQGVPGFPRGNRLVPMGDSISAASIDGPHGAMWTASLCELTQQRITWGGNVAHGGETSAQTLARVPEALALNPGIITLTSGSNDIASAIPFATYEANITAILAAVRAAGVRFVLATIEPIPMNATFQAKAIEWNAWLRSFASTNEIDLLDFADLLTDPVTGGYKAGFDSGDGLHPSQAAHIVMAQYAADLLLPSIPAWTPDGAHTAGEDANTNTLDPTNLAKNALLQHGGSPPTNWLWTPSTGHVGSVVTDAEFKGRAWRIAVADSAAGFSQFNSGLLPVVAGRRYVVTGRSRVDVSTVVPGLFRGLRFELWPNAAAPIPIAPGLAVVRGSALWRYEVTIPSGVTGVYLVALVSDIPTGQTFTCHVGEFSLREILTP